MTDVLLPMMLFAAVPVSVPSGVSHSVTLISQRIRQPALAKAGGGISLLHNTDKMAIANATSEEMA